MLQRAVLALTTLTALAASAFCAVDPSSDPPGGLQPSQCPQFVTIGFDDNEKVESFKWILDFLKDKKNADGSPARVSFYNTSCYVGTNACDNPDALKTIWHQAYLDGHEVGNHTNSHSEGLKKLDAAGWDAEIKTCNDWLTKALPEPSTYWTDSKDRGAGIPAAELKGFRTPFLAYGGPVFPTLQSNGFQYDCSIEEGNQGDQDGTNFFWPYTLDNSSMSGHYACWLGNKDNPESFTIPDVPGFWELPNHVVMVPDDATCSARGWPTGIRAKMKAKLAWFVDKMTGFDYNLWYQNGLTKDEFVAILKYNFDLRYENNRCPFMFGAHTGEYMASYSTPGASHTERRAAIEEFITYVLSKPDARLTTGTKIVDWCASPTPLNGGTVDPDTTPEAVELVGNENSAWGIGGDAGGIPDSGSALTSGGIVTMSYTIPAQPDTNTWPGVYVDCGLPGALTGAISIIVSYKSAEAVVVQIPTQDGKDPFILTIPASPSTFTKKTLKITSFKDAGWGNPGTLDLSTASSITFAPEPADPTKVTTGSLQINSLKVPGVAWNASTAIENQSARGIRSPIALRSTSAGLSLTVPSNGTYSIAIFGLNGREISRISGMTLRSGVNSISAAPLATGVYTAQITGTAGSFGVRFMVTSH